VNTQFRRAEPGDVEQAVLLIYSAGPHEFDYAFATRSHTALDFLKAAFVAGPSIVGYMNHVVALVDDRVVGIGAFYSGAEFNRLNWEIIWRIVRFYGPVKCWSVMRKGIQLQKLMSPPKKDAEFIQTLGVAEDMQGKGIGTSLLKRNIEKARGNNRRICALDVAVTNPRVQELYEKLGFCVVEERKWHVTGSAVQVPDQRRMELVL
jgi:ribosomal protein S18 acetylase RimI-like enzyme